MLGGLGGGPGAVVQFLGEEDGSLVGRVVEPEQRGSWGLGDSSDSRLTGGVAEGTGEAVVGRVAGPIRGRAAAAVVPICVEELGGVLFIVGPGTVLAAAVVAGVSAWVWFAIRPYRGDDIPVQVKGTEKFHHSTSSIKARKSCPNSRPFLQKLNVPDVSSFIW